MPFFDWLNEDEKKRRASMVGVRTPVEPVPTLKRAPEIEQGVEIPELSEQERIIQTPSTFKAATPEFKSKYSVSPERSEFLQKQNAASSALKNRAAEMLRKHARHGGPDPESLRIGDALRTIESADINTTKKLAEILKQAFTSTGIVRTPPEFEQFKRDNEEFNRMMFRSTVGEAVPAAIDPMKLEEARAGMDKALENMAVASTDEDRAFWSEKAEDLRKIVKNYEARQKQAEAAQPKPLPPPTPEERGLEEKKLKDDVDRINRERAFSGDDGTPGRDSIFEVFSTFSKDGRREFVTQAGKMLRKIGESIPISSPTQRVAFFAALPIYAEALGNEALQRVVAPMALWEKERERSERMAGEYREDLKAKRTEATTARDVAREQLLATTQKIANDNVLNTPLGVVAFILTSLVLGPKLSVFIFSRSINRGRWNVEANFAASDIKQIEARIAGIDEMQLRASRDALETNARFGLQAQEATERRAGMREGAALDHYYKMKQMEAQFRANVALGKGGKDPAQAALLQGYKNQQNVLSTAEKEMEALRKEVDQWSSKASSAIDGNLKQDFMNRWKQAEGRLKDATERFNRAEEMLKRMYARWIELYGNAPSEEPSTAEAGGE